VSPQDYLDWRDRFGAQWWADNRFMTLLDPVEQWSIHDYFDLVHDKGIDEALSYQATLQACDPDTETTALTSLDKLKARIDSVVQAAKVGPAPEVKRKRPHKIRVRAVVRPEVDIDRLVDALLRLMHDMPMGEETDATSAESALPDQSSSSSS
jgi:hypothetical protein